MKDLISIELNAVSGGTCAGGNMQMCVSTIAKTGSITGSCSSTISGYDIKSKIYFYCYVAGGTKDVATMAADEKYCDLGDSHYYQDTTHAGKDGSYATCT